MNPPAQGEPKGVSPREDAAPLRDANGAAAGEADSPRANGFVADGGVYIWQVPGNPVAVHVPLEVVDRLSAELMRGYGANPKRGAEVGGVLIGKVEAGAPAIVRIEDFEVVPCQYRRGPSYIFTEDDCEPFERAGERPNAVGYFRSHTREGLALGDEDIELLDHFFGGPTTVALLVKPFATKASEAGIFIRENGRFPKSSPLVFPFRRQELTGGEPPARRSLIERRPRRRERGEETPPPSLRDGAAKADAMRANGSSSQGNGAAVRDFGLPEITAYRDGGYGAASEGRSSSRSGWVWIPLSFVFLVLGGLLGYEAALSMGARAANSAQADYSMALAVTRAGENLSVHWDRLAPAVRASQRGLLEIEENGVNKPVSLDAAQLQNGTLTYRNSTKNVRFTLTVFPKQGVSVAESAEWRE